MLRGKPPPFACFLSAFCYFYVVPSPALVLEHSEQFHSISLSTWALLTSVMYLIQLSLFFQTEGSSLRNLH